MKKEAVVKKPNEAIMLGNRLGANARKVFNAFLWHGYPKMLKEDIHTLKVNDLLELIGSKSHNWGALQPALIELMTTVIEVMRFEGSKDEEWTGSTLIGSARIKKGSCEFSFPAHLRQMLHRPEFYTRFYLEVQRRLRSYHALALYEVCKRFEKVRSTGWIDVLAWRKLLGVEKKIHYRDFKNFSREVIKRAVKEINLHSDILITPEYKRENRRVVKIRFLIEKNPQFTLFEQLKPKEEDINSEDAELNRQYEEAISGLTSEHRTLLEEIFEHDVVAPTITLRRQFEKSGYESFSVQIAFQQFVIEQVSKKA